MAKKKETTQVPGTKLDVEDLASDMGVEEYRDSDYAERRSERPREQYHEEYDPILAVGDNRVVVPDVGDEVDPLASTLASEPSAQGAPLIEIPPGADPIAKLAAVLANAINRPAPTMDTRLMERLVTVMEKVVAGQAAATEATAAAVRRNQDPSNVHAPGVSVFNPRGERDYPRPRIKFRAFLPWEAEWESMTREEIELVNLLESGDYYVRRNDESRVKLTIRTSDNPNTGEIERLLMNTDTAFNNDYAYLMPPLRSILRQVLSQRPHTKAAAEEVMTMEEEMDLIDRYGVDFEKVLELQKQGQET